MTVERGKKGGVQSVEIAAEILKAILRNGGNATLTRVSEWTDMPPAKVHRYLASLARSGLVEQDAATPSYGIGPLSLELGLAALGSMDTVEIGSRAMAALRDRLNETTVLTIWGSHGPTIVRFMESSHPVTVNVRVGHVLPVLSTALGRVFLAYLETDSLLAMAEAERRGLGLSKKAINDLAAATRKRGLARIEGDLVPGVSAMAAPVFDYRGEISAAIGAIGRSADFDCTWDGKIATELAESARNFSRRLGHSPAA